MIAIGVGLLTCALGVILLLIVEFRQYRTGRLLLSKRGFCIRLGEGLLMLIICGIVFVGLFVLHLQSPDLHPKFFLFFWSGCMLVVSALIVLVFADLREVRERFNHRQHELWRDLGAFIASTAQKQKHGSDNGQSV